MCIRDSFTVVANEIEVGQSVEVHGDRLLYWWDGRAGFFELATDPGEQDDLYTSLSSTDDPRLDYLWGLLAPHTEAMDAALPDESPSAVD